MASLDNVTKIIQARTRNQEETYKANIQQAILSIWAMAAKYGNWWFLDEVTPIPLSVSADVSQYTLSKPLNDIGHLLYIANQHNRKIWTFKDRRQFQLYRAGRYVRQGSDDSDTSTGTVAIFTLLGLAQEKPRIQVHPTPSQSQTVYVHYRQAGLSNNFGNLPAAWEKVIVHGVMSILAPPDKVAQDYWRAVTYKEDELFMAYLGEMIRLEGAGFDDNERELELEWLTEDRITEINDL